MFIEKVTTSTEELELIREHGGPFSDDPPDGLLAAISWLETDGNVTVVMAWETPGARGDFAAEKIMPLVEEGKVTSKPDILEPYRVFVRS